MSGFSALGVFLNVHIFSFLGEEEIIQNLNNYADYMHYHKNVCRHITECFADGSCELTEENYEERFAALKKMAQEYNYGSIWDDWYDAPPRYGTEEG